MKLDIDPRIGNILEAQVAAGLFGSVEEALRAAVLGAPPRELGDLSWAKSYLTVADADIAQGRVLSEEEVFDDLLQEIDGR